MQKVKVTKRERKAKNGLNAMARHCAKVGKDIIVGLVTYRGKNPVFADLNANTLLDMPNYQKVSAGVPFVRVTSA